MIPPEHARRVLPPSRGRRRQVHAIPRCKARATAVDFEAQFLNTMFNQMFTGIDGDGPFGGGPAVGVWRSFLTDQYAKTFAKAGGVGIADQVYRTLIAHQEAQAQAHDADADALRSRRTGAVNHLLTNAPISSIELLPRFTKF